MKNVYLGILACIVVAVMAIGADITQTSTYTTEKPTETNRKFYNKTTEFCYKAANTDIPALIVRANKVDPSVTALALTNGQAVTVSRPTTYLATPAGLANTFTNTITIANPVAVGDEVTFVVASAATNKLGLADSGNLKLSAAFAGDGDDAITLKAVTSSVWVETSRSAN